MEQKRIRSAWEIALERAEKLGEFSPEEVRAQEEATYGPIGASLASRYLAGLPARDFQLFLDQHDGQPRRIVERSAALALVDALDLDDPNSSALVLEALRLLLSDPSIDPAAREARQIVEEYRKTREEKLADQREWATMEVERRLQNLGIAGSAVCPNLAGTREWQELVEKTRSSFADQLASLKRTLHSRISEHFTTQAR